MSERDEFEAAWNEWKANEDAHGGFVSFKDFTAGYRAARAPQGVPALTDEAAMRVALRIMANLEDRKGVLDGVDDDTKADIADEIAVAILAAPQPSPEPKEAQ